MKLSELKKRFAKKYVVRMAAGVLTITLIGGGMSVYTVYGEKYAKTDSVGEETADTSEKTGGAYFGDGTRGAVTEKEIGKEENVFLITDASGNVKQTIVTDRLVNADGAAVIKDASDLSDIENVRGDETFTKSENAVTWQANGKDIYYQGNSKKQAPVSQKVTYYLDGKEISPEELAGKSGKVTIRFDYINNTSFEEEVNGVNQKVCVPFAAITAVVLGDGFSNVEVEGGRLENTGNSNVVIGYAFPGIKESLLTEDSDFGEEINIPDSFEITADVKNFSLETAMTLVVNAGNFMSASEWNTEELDSMVEDIAQASEQLKNGSTDLAEGLDVLKGSLGEFAEGMSTLTEGLKAYTKGADALFEGTKTLQDGVGKLADNVPALTEGVSQLKDGAKAALTGSDQLKAGAGELKTGTDSLKAGAAQVSEGAGALSQGADELAAGLKGLKAGADQLSEGANAAVQMLGGMGTSLEGAKKAAVAEFDANPALQAQGITYENAAAILAAMKVNQQTLIDAIAVYAAAGDTEQVGICKEQLNTVNQAIEQLSAGIGNVTGAQKALDGVKTQLTDETVTSSLAELKDGAAQVAAGAGKLSDGAAVLAQKTGELAAGASQVSVGASQVSAGTAQLYDGTVSLTEGLAALDGGLATLKEKSGVLGQGVQQLKDGSLQLKLGAGRLVENNADLNSGAARLLDGTKAITEGVGKLDEGAHTLADGMSRFDEDAVSKIVNAYNGDAKTIANRIQALVDAGESYHTFTDIAEGVNGSVKFIYKMEAVKAAE